MKKIEEQVNSRIDKVEHNLDKYRSEILEFKDEVIGEIKICNSIENLDIQISNPPSPIKVISQATTEVQSKVERRNNILVFNVPESECNMKNKVVIDDTNIFLELCNIVEVGVQESDIGTMKRIGKTNQKRIIKGEEKIVSRPLLMTFCNANVKHKVMKNECKLRKADDKFRMMSIKHDMTQEERDQDKKLRAEAKDKQEIDKS
jgi:hypothetical protein